MQGRCVRKHAPTPLSVVTYLVERTPLSVVTYLVERFTQ